MEAATQDIQAAKPPARKEPMEGIALLELVAKLILKGADYRAIAKKASIPERQAMELHAEVFRQLWGEIKSAYGPDYLKARHFALVKAHEQTVRRCDQAVNASIREGGMPNTRPYTHKNAALKQIALLEGHNAPVHTVVTDDREFAAFNGERMRRAIVQPKVRAAVLALEEALAEAEQDQPEVIDVESRDVEGSA